MKLKDAQQEFVDRLLELLSNGIIPWQADWDQGILKPINGISGKPYRGFNQLNLWIKTLTSGFDDPRWLTFKQANELGCKIKKGSVGSNVYHYSFKDERTNKYVPYNEYVEMEPEEKEHIKTLTKVYKVFNGSQITGLEPLPNNQRVVSFSNALAADFVDQLQVRMGVDVLQHKSKAFYRISEDAVYMPDKSLFHTEQGYYATILHEMAHASGHESRLNREFGKIRDSDEYAIEELKAEISSAFLSMEVGFSMDSEYEKNHQAYIQNWMRAIQNDQRVLFDAIKEASGIQSYLVETGRLNELKEKHKQELTEESEQRVQVQVTRPQTQLNEDEQILERQPATIEVDSEDLKEARSEEDIAKSILTKWNNEFPVPYHIVEADKGNYKVAIFDHPGKAEHYFQYRHALNEWVHDTENKDSILQIEGLDSQEIDFLRKTYAVGIDNRVFVDMDGVLARFNNQISSIEVLYEKGYYSSLEPLENVVKAVSDLIDNSDAEVYILSAVLDSEYAADEKREWLQKYLPKIDNDHIIFSEYGYPKSNYIPGGIKSNDVLLDDYTKNLDEWTAVGAKGIKLINDINDTNQSWQGMRVNYDDQDLSKVLFENINRMQNSEGIVIPEEVEAEINELLTSEENDLSDSDRVAALQEFLHSEQEKLAEMMKVEQFYPNEKQILRQQEIVDNVLNQYNAAVAKSNKVRNDQEQIISKNNEASEAKNNATQNQQQTTTKGSTVSLDTIKNSVSIAEYARDVLGMGLIKESRGMFRLDAHDSCKIYPNNTFYRFSQGVGGSIVDFIKHFQEVDTKEAIAILKQHYKESNPDERFNSGEKATNKSVVRGFDKDLEVPEKGSTNKNVYAYLTKTRGISADIVNDYLKRGLLYQDVNNNCVFVGRLDRIIHYAMVRGTGRGKFRQDVAGSVKEVGIYVENNSDTLIVNEAAIDQMSYQTLVQDPKAYSYLACNGASNVVNAIRFHMNKRAEATNLNRVIIALDNDAAGIENTEKAVEYLKEDYPDLEVRVHLPENANDFNDQLKNELNQLKEMGIEQNISGSNLEMT